jgi:hypothetical protein
MVIQAIMQDAKYELAGAEREMASTIDPDTFNPQEIRSVLGQSGQTSNTNYNNASQAGENNECI